MPFPLVLQSIVAIINRGHFANCLCLFIWWFTELPVVKYFLCVVPENIHASPTLEFFFEESPNSSANCNRQQMIFCHAKPAYSSCVGPPWESFFKRKKKSNLWSQMQHLRLSDKNMIALPWNIFLHQDGSTHIWIRNQSWQGYGLTRKQILHQLIDLNLKL